MTNEPQTGTNESTGLPPEVENLPASLDKPLATRQKKADERRRDELMRLSGSAARLSEHERTRAHAIVRSSEYRVELDRLLALRPLKFKERRVTKPELERRIKITAHNLIDALTDAGDLALARAVLQDHHPKHEKGKHLIALRDAIARSDDNHCDCPPEDKHVQRTIWVPTRQQYVEVLTCLCGHTNATATLPDDVLALRRAPQAFTGQKGVTDEHVMGHVKKGQLR